MSSNENAVIKVLKLSNATYRQWYDTLVDVLEALDLDMYINEFKYENRSPENPITGLQKSKIAKVRNIIKQSLGKEDLESILDLKNPKEMLAELERKYRGPGAKSAWELLKDLDSIKFDGSIPCLFSQLRQLYSAFADKNIKLPHHIINSKVRSVLPPEYSDMCTMLDIYNGGRLESDYMSDKQFESELLRFDRERNLVKTDVQSTSLAAVSSPSLPEISSTTLAAATSKKRFNGICHYCGIQGHIERFCHKKNRSNRFISNQSVNRYNGNNGDNYSSKNGAVTLSAVVRSPNPFVNPQLSKVLPSGSLSLVSASSVKFLADCGASYHIVNDRSLLTNIRNTNGSIRTLSGEIVNPEQGDMSCHLFNGQKWIPMVIKDVFYVADQPFNLIAIGKICNNDGFSQCLNKNGMIVYRYRKPILIGNWSNDYVNLIELLIRVNGSSTGIVSAVASAAAVNSLSCWHERFGHFSVKSIAKMVRQQCVTGIPLRLKDDIDFCSSCCLGKTTDVSHHLENDVDHIKPGFKLHLDIGGYLDPSIHGNKYFLLAVDHNSRYMKVAFMKSRDQTLEKFKRIVNEVKMDIGVDVLCIRTDMGTEFCSNSFKRYLEERGIIHEKATVATPQQNGRCERAMRTLMNHSVSLLSSTDLPRNLWDEAVNCTAYLFNRVLNSRNVIPYQQYFGRKPDVSNLRIFGSGGEALVKDRHSKFDPKTKFVRMVGYQGESIYRVFVPSTRRIELCSSVIFNEKPKCSFDVRSNVNESSNVINDADNFISVSESSEGGIDVNNENRRGPGRPVGSRNRLYQRDEERIASLRQLPSRSFVGVGVQSKVIQSHTNNNLFRNRDSILRNVCVSSFCKV